MPYSQNKKAIFLKITDALSDSPAPYARIFYNKNRSIITDENGKGVLFYDKSCKEDTVEIIAAGFYSKKQVLDIDKNFLQIKLTPEPKTLLSVEIKAGHVNNCFSGKLPKSEAGGFISTDGKRRGSEVAAPLEWKKKNTARLGGIGLIVLKNENPDTVLLRINLYQIKHNTPDSLMASRNLKVFGKEDLNKKLWVYFNGIPLVPEQSFAVSLECLTEDAGLDKFCFSTSGKKEGWVRYAGYSFWKKVRGGSFLFEPLIICE